MLFKSKKILPSLKLYGTSGLLYDGLLKDLPLKESIILQKSGAFFDDPEPCHIHRSAVRTRLVAELQRELHARGEQGDETPGPLLTQYADCASICRCQFKES